MKSKVYFTSIITPDSLVKIFDKLGVELQGKVAVKISTGEPGGNNYLKPELIGNLVKHVNGVIVECNTAYGGGRGDTASHLQVAKDHGFTNIAEVEILDSEGEIELPVNGEVLDVNIVGKGIEKYDTIINLAHFKGHVAGGFGGVLKNQSIGFASPAGKAYIHTARWTRDPETLMECFSENPPFDVNAIQDQFLEAMAEAAKSIDDYMKQKTGREHPIAYINVMNNLSRSCDCEADPEAPCMADIGILASLDPVALDQASVDLLWNSEDAGRDMMIERVEERHGRHILGHAAKIGLGSREYDLEKID